MKSMHWFYRGQLSHYNFLINRLDELRKEVGYKKEVELVYKMLWYKREFGELIKNPYYIKKGRNMVSSYGDK